MASRVHMSSKKICGGGKPYCVCCSNFSGKVVEGRVVKLHKLPSHQVLKRAWQQRLRLIRQDYSSVKHPRICSEHFVHRQGPKPGDDVPSVFPNRIFKTCTVSIVQVGEALDQRYEERLRVRRQQQGGSGGGGGGGGGSRPSSAGGAHSDQQDHTHRSAGGRSAGWWTVAKSTGSPYLMDQRFPLRFGSSHQRHPHRSNQHQHSQKQHPADSKSSGPQSEHPHHQKRLVGASTTGSQHRVPQGRGSSTPPASPGRDSQTTHGAGRESSPREPLYLERQHSMPALSFGKDHEKDGVQKRRCDESSPRQHVHSDDTDRVTSRRRHSHGGDCCPRRQTLSNRVLAATRPGSDDEEPAFHPRHNENNNDHLDDTSRFCSDAVKNSLLRSHTFDVPMSPKHKGSGKLSLAKCLSDYDENVVHDRRHSDAAGSHRSTVRYHSGDEVQPDGRQSAKPTAQFCRASLALMQAQDRQALPASGAAGSPLSSPRGGAVTSTYTPLQKFRQQYLEAQLHLQQYRQFKERLSKQLHRQYGAVHRPAAVTTATTTSTKQPKSILRSSPTAAKNLSSCLQRGMSVYIEKLLVLSDRPAEAHAVAAQAATQAAATAASSSSPRDARPSSTSIRPQKRVTFGTDVIFDVTQSDVGMTSRVLNHLSEC